LACSQPAERQRASAPFFEEQTSAWPSLVTRVAPAGEQNEPGCTTGPPPAGAGAGAAGAVVLVLPLPTPSCASAVVQWDAIACCAAAQLPVPGSAYPGAAAFRAQALPGCKASIAAVVDRSKLTATTKLLWLYPLPQSWADGQKTISCLIVDSSQDLTSSLLK
jgi:hypothetical protein